MVDVLKPIPAQEVVNAITHGLTSDKPKYVYIIGNDAKIAFKLSLFPKSLLNWLVMKRINKIAESSNLK